MNVDKNHVLIVDDCANDIHVLMENLKPEYAVLAATSGDKALQLASKNPQPDVILLDAVMPEMDGYETCRRLKADSHSRDIDVIFVSANDTIEEKLAGYEAGASDYLIKPVQTEVLLQKVRLAVENRHIRSTVRAENEMAMKTAMTAISNAGEQGVILNFMRHSITARSIEDLASLIVEAVANYGLENSVQIRGTYKFVNVSSSEPMSPLEKELLLRLKNAGRIRESGKRFIANFGDISLLIKNMPEEQDKRGRLRDHLAVMLEGADARLRALETGSELALMMKESNQALKDIQAMQIKQKENAMQIIDDVMKRLEESFLSYGLTEDQEKLLLDIVQDGINRSLDNFESGLMVDEKLQSIVSRLQQVARR